METSSSASAAKHSVLILDADQHAALAIARSLGRRGLTVEVASADTKPITKYSKYVSNVLRYPDPLTDELAFGAWMQQIMAKHTHELIIPVTERTLVPLMQQHGNYDASRIAMALPNALEHVLDKSKTLALAATLGIPIPQSLEIHSVDQLESAIGALTYPIVIKPTRSVGKDNNHRVQLSVSYAHNPNELMASAQHALRFGGVMLQEYFHGTGVGIELIADHGEIGYSFQHRRLHEVPLTGGGSSLRVSEAVIPALLTASEKLMHALNWHGVAMVEFKYQPNTGLFCLMEINGRFWGSLPLAIAAGADFPSMLYSLYSTGKIDSIAPAKTGILCRNLRRDLDWLEHVLRKAAPPTLVTLPSIPQIFKEQSLVLSPRHHFDIQTLNDPKPGFIDLWRIASDQWQRIKKVAVARHRLQRERRRAQSAGRTTMTVARQVLFLCYGNINRSALAHAYAETKGMSHLSFSSAGFHLPQGRPADPVMIETAAHHGIDLGKWHSQTVTEELVENADIILAMEASHLDRLASRFPSARSRAFLLAALDASTPAESEIDDPYGKLPDFYERVCKTIMHKVDIWLDNGTPPSHRH